MFFQWLSGVPFSGGGFNDVAIAEGLSEALMMLSPPNGGGQAQGVECQRHCILVASSNPYILPTPVYCPQKHILEQQGNSESQMECLLYDAEGVAKVFGQCSISLSVISPKQLPKLRAIYNMGKFNSRSADVPVDSAKNPHFLVLISENFTEACSIFSRTGPTNQSPVKVDTVSVPTTAALSSNLVPTVAGGVFNRQPVSVGAVIKSEPGTMTTMVSGTSFSHISAASRPPQAVHQSMQASSPSSSSQEVIPTNESSQDVKPTVNGMMLQTLRPVSTTAANVSILNNISQARQVMNNAALNVGASVGFQSIHASPMSMPMQMSNIISNTVSSSVPIPQAVLSGQPAVATMNGSASLIGSAMTSQNSALGPFTQSNSNLTISQSLGNLQGGAAVNQLMSGIGQGSLQIPQMVQTGVSMNQSMMTVGSSSISSGNGTMIPTPGIQQQIQPVMHSLNVDNASSNNHQQSSGAMQMVQSRYLKIWEGCLSGQRQGNPVYITKLEAYRNITASETIAANWPPTMQIFRLISSDHMNNKLYAGKADYIVFRVMNPHGFLDQLQEKKLCSVIQLPTQTLLLSVSDKATRLIGMLFPEEMVIFKPPGPSSSSSSSNQQQLSQMQQNLLAQMPVQQQQQLLAQMQSQQQQQQQHQQQQLVVGGGMGQGYNIQGMGRPQMAGSGMGQLSSQGHPQSNMSRGGGFLG